MFLVYFIWKIFGFVVLFGVFVILFGMVVNVFFMKVFVNIERVCWLIMDVKF